MIFCALPHRTSLIVVLDFSMKAFTCHDDALGGNHGLHRSGHGKRRKRVFLLHHKNSFEELRNHLVASLLLSCRNDNVYGVYGDLWVLL